MEKGGDTVMAGGEVGREPVWVEQICLQGGGSREEWEAKGRLGLGNNTTMRPWEEEAHQGGSGRAPQQLVWNPTADHENPFHSKEKYL